MSKQTITLTSASRKANRAQFVAANPWTPGKTIAEIKAIVESGDQKLKGGFTFAEEASKSNTKTVTKSATATTKANKKAKVSKKEQAAKDQKQADFLTWLRDTAEARKARQRVNRKAAKFCNKNGVHPRGLAWAEVLNGERDIAVLRGLNDRDGLRLHEVRVAEGETVKVAKKGAKVKVGKVTQVVAESDPASPARKRPHRANGAFMSKTEADTYFALVDTGLDEKIARKAVEVLA